VQVATVVFPQAGLDSGLYALLGMGGMMGASLQAPLAALTAMMELTHSPQLIMPGMLVIVVAGLTASELLHKESLFVAMLKANDMDYSTHPVMQLLRRIGVASVMNQRFKRAERTIAPGEAQELLADSPEWILIQGQGAPVALMPAVDLARYLQEHKDEVMIDLAAIPGQRHEVAAIHLQATLQEALEVLDRQRVDALYVERVTAPGIRRVYGILTRKQIESAYRL